MDCFDEKTSEPKSDLIPILTKAYRGRCISEEEAVKAGFQIRRIYGMNIIATDEDIGEYFPSGGDAWESLKVPTGFKPV